MQRIEYISQALLNKNPKCILYILDQVTDLYRTIDIAERRLKIPRHVAVQTIRKIYFEEKLH